VAIWQDGDIYSGDGRRGDDVEEQAGKNSALERTNHGGQVMRDLLERLELHEAIPQDNMKRAEVRAYGSPSYMDSGATTFGLKQSDVIGWFSNKHNEAAGWTIFAPSSDDVSEFGPDAKRTYSYAPKTTNIVKFDLKKGTYAFLDNDAYENDGIVKYQKMSPYRKLMIEQTSKAFKAFGIV
jgi:hypothetical protein